MNSIDLESSNAPLRILIGKVGLDGHDRGAKIIARVLRDAGCEVIYSGLHQTPSQIVTIAIQEDVDAIGLSILSGAHNDLFRELLALLKEEDSLDCLVFGGGIIPPADIPILEALGVAKVFTPGALSQDIVEWLYDEFPGRQSIRFRTRFN
jgi:methylmalonyl-CoA mutase C-terminal domain/subunit